MSNMRDYGKNANTQLVPFSRSRRKFIVSGIAGLGAMTVTPSSTVLSFMLTKKIRAIAFDAFPVFDTRPIFKLIEKKFPEKGIDLGKAWREKQFEYSWLRTAGGQYKDFWNITKDALIFAGSKTGVSLTTEEVNELMDQYLSLKPWPDVLPAIQTFKQKGITLSFLSNMTNEMLTSSMKHSNIESYFDAVISTDDAKTYKPNPGAYQLGVDTLKLKEEEILFVAFAGWDASGAKWFGYPTFWLNRLGSPAEELDANPDGMGTGMTDLINFLKL